MAMIIRSLAQVRESLPPGTAVLVSGAFDPLHYGHIRYLRAAAKHADDHQLPLVVATAPDEYVQRRHPLLQRIDERMEMMDAIRGVAFVVPQESESLAQTIRRLQPRYVVKGTDWKAHGLPPDEVAAIEEVGAELIWTEISPDVSSSGLLHAAFWRFADEWVGRT
jgi:phosphoenolpyruvate phosphomutase / 2-hydroxyethylphosphonate cytidylyltransferase